MDDHQTGDLLVYNEGYEDEFSEASGTVGEIHGRIRMAMIHNKQFFGYIQHLIEENLELLDCNFIDKKGNNLMHVVCKYPCRSDSWEERDATIEFIAQCNRRFPGSFNYSLKTPLFYLLDHNPSIRVVMILLRSMEYGLAYKTKIKHTTLLLKAIDHKCHEEVIDILLWFSPIWSVMPYMAFRFRDGKNRHYTPHFPDNKLLKLDYHPKTAIPLMKKLKIFMSVSLYSFLWMCLSDSVHFWNVDVREVRSHINTKFPWAFPIARDTDPKRASFNTKSVKEIFTEQCVLKLLLRLHVQTFLNNMIRMVLGGHRPRFIRPDLRIDPHFIQETVMVSDYGTHYFYLRDNITSLLDILPHSQS